MAPMIVMSLLVMLSTMMREPCVQTMHAIPTSQGRLSMSATMHTASAAEHGVVLRKQSDFAKGRYLE
jgi:hypothetical protein